MDVEASVRGFLKDHVPVGQDSGAISPDESLLDSGLLDSASILQLVSFLEERFGIVISDEELVPDNFETINAIVGLVQSKGATREPPGDPVS
jgi:acyl carrier protein